MKLSIITAVFLLLFTNSNAQKPLVNDTTFRIWTYASTDARLSGDGKFIIYGIRKPDFSERSILINANRTWKMELLKYTDYNFTDDSKYLLALQGDSLIQLNLHSKKINIIPNCSSYKLQQYGQAEWLMYQLKDSLNTLVVLNMRNNKTSSYHNVQGYFTNSGTLILKSEIEKLGTETLTWIDLKTGLKRDIYKGFPSSGYVFNGVGDAMAFWTKTNNKKSIWCYRKNQQSSAQLIAADNAVGIQSSYHINTEEIWRFSGSGKFLYFNQNKDEPNEKPNSIQPDIWNYQDEFLLSKFKKIKGTLNNGYNLTAVDINSRIVKQILFNNLKPVVFSEGNKDLVVAQEVSGDELETEISYYLCDVNKALITKLADRSKKEIRYFLSPDSKFLMYYNHELKNYISENLETGMIENLTSGLSHDWYTYHSSSRGNIKLGTGGVIGWTKEGHAVLQGTFDLFEVDLANKSKPLNLTKDIGLRDGIIFSPQCRLLPKILFNGDDKLLIGGFSLKTKEFSIYQLYGRDRLLVKKFAANKLLGLPYDWYDGFVKANKSDTYLLAMQDAANSRNWFITKDFEKLSLVSEVHPEKEYNWITSELATYKDKNGDQCQGILYKPENFDPEKKYPVIFYYYEDIANRVHEYMTPESSSIGFNMPILISNGYLVFKPDMYRTPGRYSEGIMTSILAAADYLSSKSWVDSTTMGLCGQSFGGFETNYIVTHSNRFSAALSATGASNLFQHYSYNGGDLDASGGGNHNIYFVIGAYNMGKRLNEVPEEYFRSSPLISAKNMNTPLLLMHNYGDTQVSADQSLQFFSELRALNKTAWWVQYPHSGHGIAEEFHIDFQEKVIGFFDHYLKGKPMPGWMTKPNKQNWLK